jgi:hypothetical protein
MKKTVLTFGLISGAIMVAMMFATLPFMDKIGFDKGAIIGYTTMILAFMLLTTPCFLRKSGCARELVSLKCATSKIDNPFVWGSV